MSDPEAWKKCSHGRMLYDRCPTCEEVSSLKAERDAAIARAEELGKQLAEATPYAGLTNESLRAHVERLREALVQIDRDRKDAEADMKAEWGKVDSGSLYGHAWGYMTNALNHAQAALSSTPEQNLTALREQVRREALEEGADHLHACAVNYESDDDRDIVEFCEDELRALATNNRVPERTKP